VFTGSPVAAPAGVGVHRVDRAFVQSWAAGEPDEAGSGLVASQSARLTTTSGSSGKPRLMLLTQEVLDRRIRTLLDVPCWDLEAGTRLLVLAPLTVNAAYLRLCGSLRRGGAVVVGPGSAAGALAPTHIHGLPAQLARFLDDLPPGHVFARPVQLGTLGGRVAPELAARARAVFHAGIDNRYGTNETSTICTLMDSQATGAIDAGVAVRILDAAGREMPAGVDGLIAVRSASMVDGYLGDPQATAAAFRDGWFHTGDVGRLVEPRRLRLLGRHDDLVVLGGVKVPAGELEDELRRQPCIADCAVLALHGDGDAALAVVAVLRDPAMDTQAAAQQLAGALRLEVESGFRLLLVPALPRLPGGKVDRLALLRALQAAPSAR
jgi:acyl-coenzyme A synthetase/AMP-(fatty) acid ligase